MLGRGARRREGPGAWVKRHLTADPLLGRLLPAEVRLRWRYQLRLGRTPDLRRPRTFNEKLNWLKLHWRDPRAPGCCDKLAVRAFVEARCGPEVLNELHGVYRTFDDIDLAALPDAFVLKATHGSGFNVLCPDKRALDVAAARARFRGWMRREFGRLDGEWPYLGLPRRIVCERWLGSAGAPPEDYKLFCFDGEPRLIEVHTKRGADHRMTMYDLDWRTVPVRLEHPPTDEPAPRPAALPELLRRGRELAAGFPFVRVDLYVVAGRVVFGELTFFPTAGLKVFGAPADDLWLGEFLRLPPAGRAAADAGGGLR